MGDNSTPPGHGWKEMAFNWLFQQGTSTVLLVAILIAMWYGGPAAYDRIDKANREERLLEREHAKAMLQYVVDECCNGNERTRATAGNP